MTPRLPLVTVLALGLPLAALREREPDRLCGAWVGEIETSRGLVPFALRIDPGPTPEGLVTRVQRVDGNLPPMPATSTERRENGVRIAFDRGGTSWSLDLERGDDGLLGDFSSAGGTFEARFVSMEALERPELEGLAGPYRREDGTRLRLDVTESGYLRACFPDEGRFQYLFPSDPADFFAGPGLLRADPRTLRVTFDEDGLEWKGAEAEPWRAKRLAPDPLRLSLEEGAIRGPGLELPLVRVEPGEFLFGEPRSGPQVLELLGMPADAPLETSPPRPTRIAHPFLLGRVEVTEAWFRAFVRETGTMTDAERLGSGLVWNGQSMEAAPEANWRAPGVETASDRPAVMVSWNDAVAFCAWMSAALGRTVRLPTEAEWEYACRAGTETLFSWGDDPAELEAHAWGYPRAKGPGPVGALLPNAWGLCDMHGNAWEWCSDYFAPVGSEPAVDPRGPTRGQTRVLRGGSWINGAFSQRSAFRAGEDATLAEPHIGFRVVVELEREAPADPAVAARIRNVENGLLPPVRIRGREVRMRLEERMAHHGVPGLGVAVLHDGRIEWARGYGHTDRDGGQPVTPETLFQAGSISKPVTALAALRLVERGELDLDADVDSALTSWKVPESELTRTEKVTLRRLLSHSAGLSVHGFPGYAAGAALPPLAQILDGTPPANTEAVRVVLVPGTRWSYSGGGYTVLQQLLEDVTGQPFPETLRTLVLEPIGMTNSSFEPPPADMPELPVATGHGPLGPVEHRWRVHPELAAAGLWTTPSDLARLLLAVQGALAGRSDLLSRATAREMVAVQAGGHGLGPSVAHAGEPSARFEHGGVNEGFEALFVAYVERGEGAVVMTNASGGMALASEVMRSIAREYGWPDYLSPERVPVEVSASALERVAGLYENEDGSRVRFRVTRGRLWGENDVSTFELHPESEVAFFSDAGLAYRFEPGEKGVVRGLTIEADGQAFPAARVGD